MNEISKKRRDLYRLAGRDPSEYKNHVLLDICTACGADCIYCLHQAANLAPSKIMSREHFFVIADILQREGYELVYLYQSGESFLHPDYCDFIVAIAERGMASNTATKLFMPIKWDKLDAALTRCDATGKTVEFLITVDSLDQEAQDKIGPGINIERVKSNLIEMARLNEAHPHMKCILDTVVNAYNEHQIEQIEAHIKGLGFTQWFAKRMGYFMPSLARKEDLVMIGAAIPSSTEHPARFSIVDGELIPAEEQSRCDLGGPAVSPEGDVTVCCHDMLHLNRLGNVIEMGSLRDIIASDRFQKAADKGRNMGLKICRGCN